jgi:prolipoprotein diacylglyceryltransferase
VIVYYSYWKTSKALKSGYMFGLFLTLLWVTRFIVEFFKEAQVAGREDWILGMNTGQTLSIPFIFLGIYYMFRK